MRIDWLEIRNRLVASHGDMAGNEILNRIKHAVRGARVWAEKLKSKNHSVRWWAVVIGTEHLTIHISSEKIDKGGHTSIRDKYIRLPLSIGIMVGDRIDRIEDLPTWRGFTTPRQTKNGADTMLEMKELRGLDNG